MDMKAISKEVFDGVFSNLPFWEAVDTCIDISRFNLECQINDKIDLHYFLINLDKTGFITYDTSTGSIYPFREIFNETNLREL